VYSRESAATLARPALFAVRVGENFLRGFRLLGQDQLQVMSERVFDSDDVLVRNADAVGERADDRARLAQGGLGARAETFVRTFEAASSTFRRERSRPVPVKTGSCSAARTMAQISPSSRRVAAGSDRADAWSARSVSPPRRSR